MSINTVQRALPASPEPWAMGQGFLGPAGALESEKTQLFSKLKVLVLQSKQFSLGKRSAHVAK